MPHAAAFHAVCCAVATAREPDASHDPFAAVRLATYRRFAVAFLASSLALQMAAMALGWEIYERTGDAFLLGLMGVARALPVVALALPAGQMVDWLRRERVISATWAAFAVVMAAIALSIHGVAGMRGSVWALLGLVAVMGMIRTFNGPARSSLLPDLVPGEVFSNAVTWNIGIFQFSAIAGPLLAGWMIDVQGHAWGVFAACSGMCGVAAILASTIKPLRVYERPAGSISLRGLWRGIGEGLAHVKREKLILSTITLDLFAVLLGGATALLPVYAKDILHVDAVGLGWLRAASFIGALAMSGFLAVRPIKGKAGPMLLGSVAVFGLCMIAFGFSTSFWLSMAALMIAGAVDSVSVVIRHVLVQMRTPPALRGRVSSVNSVFIECSNELGAFESGAVAKLFGPVFSVVSGGVGTLMVVAAVAMAWPEIRKLDKLEAPKES
jgi:MFS family permease